MTDHLKAAETHLECAKQELLSANNDLERLYAFKRLMSPGLERLNNMAQEAKVPAGKSILEWAAEEIEWLRSRIAEKHRADDKLIQDLISRYDRAPSWIAAPAIAAITAEASAQRAKGRE